MKKNARSRLPVYACRRAATFNTPVPCNTSNVFEVTAFSVTVKMARVGTSCDLVICGERIVRVSVLHVTSSSAAQIYISERDSCQIDAKFNTPVSRNGSNVYEVMRRPSQNGFNQSIIQPMGFLETGHSVTFSLSLS